MKGILSFRVGVTAFVLGSMPASIGGDEDSEGCWGCLSRPLEQGYHCPESGSSVEHIGGGLMSGWYGYKAEHREAYCRYCGEVHNTCLFGDCEDEPQSLNSSSCEEPSLALEAAVKSGNWESVKKTWGPRLRLAAERRQLLVLACDGTIARSINLNDTQLQHLSGP